MKDCRKSQCKQSARNVSALCSLAHAMLLYQAPESGLGPDVNPGEAARQLLGRTSHEIETNPDLENAGKLDSCSM